MKIKQHFYDELKVLDELCKRKLGMELSQTWKEQRPCVEEQTITNTFFNSKRDRQNDGKASHTKNLSMTYASMSKMLDNKSSVKCKDYRVKWSLANSECDVAQADLNPEALKAKALCSNDKAPSSLGKSALKKLQAVSDKSSFQERRGSLNIMRSSSTNQFSGLSKQRTHVGSQISLFGKDDKPKGDLTTSTTEKDGQLPSIGSNSKAEAAQVYMKPTWRRSQDRRLTADNSNYIDSVGMPDDSKAALSKIVNMRCNQVVSFNVVKSNGTRQVVRSTNLSRIQENTDSAASPVQKATSQHSVACDQHSALESNPARPLLNKNSSLKSLKISRGRSESREAPARSDSSGLDSSKFSAAAHNLNKSMEGLCLNSEPRYSSSRSIPDPEIDGLGDKPDKTQVLDDGCNPQKSSIRQAGWSKEMLRTPFIVKKKPKTARPL